MTDRSAIEVGDLAMLVRSCCNRYLGRVFRVAGFEPHQDCFACSFCGTEHPAMTLALTGEKEKFATAPLPWIKRIPPLDELEGLHTQESVPQVITTLKTKVWTGKEPA